MNRKTFGLNLNRTRREDLELMIWLNTQPGSISGKLKLALLELLKSRRIIAELEAENGRLRRLLEGKDCEEPILEALTGAEPQDDNDPLDLQLSSFFLTAVKKAARPGMKLEDDVSSRIGPR